MRRAGLVAALMLATGSALGSLQPVGPVPYSGTGLGAVNTVLTVGGKPFESGCVARGPAGDIIGPAACPPGFAGGDERTGASQTQTRTIAQLGLTTATDLRIVLNVNQSVGSSAFLENLQLTIYSPAGAVLFSSGPFTPPTFPLEHLPGTTVGYVLELDEAQAAQAQLVFDPTNRVGLATTLSGGTAGNETFFVADVTAIGVPLFGADLAITKTAPANVIAGTNLTYSFNVVNNGPQAASNAVVSDTLPAATRFVSITIPAGWSCTTPAVGAAGTINCTKPSMAIGETATFTAVVARVCPEVLCGTAIDNTATISSATPDPVTANGTSTATTNVQTQSDVAIAKSASAAAVNPGGTIIYTLDVTNAGPSNSSATTVVDTLPAGFIATSVASTAGSCSGVGSATVTCNLGVLGADAQCATALPESATITITAQADPALAPGTYTNTATVTTGNCLADPNAANNTATIDTTVPASPLDADVAITKIAPPTVVAGTNVTYAVTVTNSGPLVAANVVVTDPLPAQTRFVSHTAPAGWTCVTPAAGTSGTVTCSKASMAVAETAAFTTVVSTCPEQACGSILTNTATVTSATADPLPANNSDSASIEVQAQADLAITKSASSATVTPGGSVTYTLNVSNAGPSNSVGTTVVDSLPAGFTASSATSSLGTCSGIGTSSVTCTLGDLGAAGQCATNVPTSATITIVAQVSASATAGTFVNTATVATGNCLGDPNLGNNTAAASTTIPPVVAPAAEGVPTLSEIGLAIFAALLLLAGLLIVRT